MSVTREQVLEIVRNCYEEARNGFSEEINRLSEALNCLAPPSIETYLPVAINSSVSSDNTSLDLIKSLPEFKGDTFAYPAWRSAAHFAMNYYKPNSEKYYVAMGIFRNKITESANTSLSSFNTVLNFKAIIARLDQTYADKRPLYVLENEMSILRQGNLQITEYFDKVDKQLTLIINKQIMSHSGNSQVINALNDRARENALRVFISGLRRSLCDILFSTRPKDLPTALAVAQELETSHKRYDFASTFAAGTSVKPNISVTPQYRQPFHSNQQNFRAYSNNKPTSMEVDRSLPSSRQQANLPTNNGFQKQFNSNNFTNVSRPQHNSNSFQPVAFKRNREQTYSNRSPFPKVQKVNYMSHEIGSNLNKGEFEEYIPNSDQDEYGCDYPETDRNAGRY